MDFDWTTITAIISAIAAVVALVLSVWQTRISNRQHLFDMKIRVWMVAWGMIELYGQHVRRFEKKDEPYLALDQEFLWLTNNTYLHEAGNVVDSLLEANARREFFAKIEEIRSMAESALYVFKGKEAKSICSFLNDYGDLLLAMYQYQILLDDMQKRAGQFKWTLEEASSRLDEPSIRNEMHECMDRVDDSYESINSRKTKRRIVRQLKLFS
ncbi:hypothetical protein [Slackia piriformis]|uniref:hypothetical protein n=1 Tax=Slackia piriformis TaxID=626934 RepID=UPI0032C18546